MRNRVLTLLAVAASGFALAGGAAHAADSTAVAINTKDGSSLVKIVFNITKIVNGRDVTTGNAAAAESSCDSCQTLAVAFQIVLASGSPDVVVPENLAIAMNVDCNLCETLADAYQWVYAGDTRMVFTKDGEQRIREIQKQLNELEHSGLPIDQIQAQVVELAAQIQDVLNTELVPAEHGLDSLNGPSSSDNPPTGSQTGSTPTDTGTSTTPSDTSTTPTDTSTTPSDTGTSTSGSNMGTSTTPSDTGTSTTPTDTQTTPTTGTDTGTGTSG